MNTNMTGFGWFYQKSLHPCALDKSSPSIGRVINGRTGNLVVILLFGAKTSIPATTTLMVKQKYCGFHEKLELWKKIFQVNHSSAKHKANLIKRYSP